VPRKYLGYTTTEARANLDALWALLLLSACNGTAPVLPPAGPAPTPMYYGRTRILANADLDAMWDALPGAPPIAPDPDGKLFVGYASTLAYADLDALVAAIAPFQCCPPPLCTKILDEQFNFADRAAFLARWQDHSMLAEAATLAHYDIICDGETTQVKLNAGAPDQLLGESWEIEFYSDVLTTGKDVWYRAQVRFDLMAAITYLYNSQTQIAFGGANANALREWFAFATDNTIGGPMYAYCTYDTPAPPEAGGNPGPGPGNPGYDHLGTRYDHASGDYSYPPNPLPGAGIMSSKYYEEFADGFATMWELVQHVQYMPNGIVRQRMFIGPIDGVKEQIADGRTYAKGLSDLPHRLTWLLHAHKNLGISRAPKLKRMEAWECSYEANPCNVQIVWPDPYPGPVASLQILPGLAGHTGIALDDQLEIIEPIAVVARDAGGTIIPNVRPEFIPFNNTGADSFESGWRQGVSCSSPTEEFDVKAWWPEGGGIESTNSIHAKSFDGFADLRRFWKIRSDSPDNGWDFSIAGLSFHESVGGPDVSGLGTPIGSAALAGTSIANAFDGNGATFYTADGAVRPQDQEIGIDFGGTPRHIDHIVITARTDRPDLGPPHFSIWTSNDGITWGRHQPYSRCSWTSGQARSFAAY
jgi:hypothetical protein